MTFKLIKQSTQCALMLMVFVLLGSCGGDSKSFIEAIEANKLAISAITIATDKPVINADGSAQYSATGIPLDISQSNIELTDSVTWSVSDTSLASIDNVGLLTAKADGVVTVEAAFANHAGTAEQLINTANLTSLQITGVVPVEECQNLQLDASGQFDDGTTRAITDEVSWNVLFPAGTTAQATIGSTSGLLQTSNAGTVTVQASTSIVTGEVLIEISDTLDAIIIAPENASLVENGTQSYSATGTYGAQSIDITDNSAFNVADTSVASFNGSRITAIAANTTEINVTCGGQQATTTITVTTPATLSSIRINEGNSLLTVDESDQTEQLELTAIFSDGSTQVVTEEAIWSVDSQDGTGTNISISNAGSFSGLVTINAGTGDAIIRVEYIDKETTLTFRVE